MDGMRVAGFMGLLVLFLIIMDPVQADEIVLQGVHNGTFEEGVDSSGDRPNWWWVGDEETPPDGEGSWAVVVDENIGSNVLELTPLDLALSYSLSQFPDLPQSIGPGSTLTFSLDVDSRNLNGSVLALMAVWNPLAPVDPDLGVPLAGKVLLQPAGSGWEHLEGSLTLSMKGYPWIYLGVTGSTGSARFDNVSLTTSLPLPSCGNGDNIHLPPEGIPPFPLGIVNESPKNLSEYARGSLVREASSMADMVNLFIHIRWNDLTGRPLLDGHEASLRQAQELRRLSIPRMVTFDFTHGNLEGLGNINPRPDGMPVERLDDPGVTDAYLDELYALVEAIRPEIVSVGIEVDFFYGLHPDQWDTYRSMVCQAHSALHALYHGIHVTTYMTLPSLVHMDASLNPVFSSALSSLQPCIDSVGYSTYPAFDGRHLDDYPDGYFSAPGNIVPGLPLIVPECGYRGDEAYPEEEQESFLQRMISELESRGAGALFVYSLYDQPYFGVDPWFKEAFSTVGLREMDGSPKRAYLLMKKIHARRPHARPFSGPPEPCERH